MSTAVRYGGEGELDEPSARQAARLCRKAGTDPEAIPGWIEEGSQLPATWCAVGRRLPARSPPDPWANAAAMDDEDLVEEPARAAVDGTGGRQQVEDDMAPLA
jgi:hypothetical protein